LLEATKNVGSSKTPNAKRFRRLQPQDDFQPVVVQSNSVFIIRKEKVPAPPQVIADYFALAAHPVNRSFHFIRPASPQTSPLPPTNPQGVYRFRSAIDFFADYLLLSQSFTGIVAS
jgi:hypothetical protein